MRDRSLNQKMILPIAFFLALPGIHFFQENAYQWLTEDYLSRLVVLAYVFAIPEVRQFATGCYGRPWPGDRVFPPRWAETLTTVALLFIAERIVDFLSRVIGPIWPETAFFDYFDIQETWLQVVDLTFGLALVAVSEELLFRGFMRSLVASLFDNQIFIVVVSAVVFGLLHWPGGLNKVIYTALVGGFYMIVYLYSKSLWPTTIAHYLTNLWVFWPD